MITGALVRWTSSKLLSEDLKLSYGIEVYKEARERERERERERGERERERDVDVVRCRIV